MNYRYLPIYKYIIFALIVILFLSYYKNINEEDYLIFVFLLVTLYIFLDFATIDSHPSLLNVDICSFLLDTEDNEEDDPIEYIEEEDENSQSSKSNKLKEQAIIQQHKQDMLRRRDGSCMA
jgi:hypothetical protein